MFLILLKTVIIPEVMRFLAERRAANQPEPTEAEIFARLRSTIDAIKSEGQAFLDATRDH